MQDCHHACLQSKSRAKRVAHNGDNGDFKELIECEQNLHGPRYKKTTANGSGKAYIYIYSMQRTNLTKSKGLQSRKKTISFNDLMKNLSTSSLCHATLSV